MTCHLWGQNRLLSPVMPRHAYWAPVQPGCRALGARSTHGARLGPKQVSQCPCVAQRATTGARARPPAGRTTRGGGLCAGRCVRSGRTAPKPGRSHSRDGNAAPRAVRGCLSGRPPGAKRVGLACRCRGCPASRMLGGSRALSGSCHASSPIRTASCHCHRTTTASTRVPVGAAYQLPRKATTVACEARFLDESSQRRVCFQARILFRRRRFAADCMLHAA